MGAILLAIFALFGICSAVAQVNRCNDQILKTKVYNEANGLLTGDKRTRTIIDLEDGQTLNWNADNKTFECRYLTSFSNTKKTWIIVSVMQSGTGNIIV